MRQLTDLVKKFLHIHCRFKAPLLLGISGGPDSLALLMLFLECRSLFSLDLHVAHLDHGWRKESEEEASLLEELVRSYQLPFHSERLPFTHLDKESNLEASSRLKRLQFFQKIYCAIGAQALVLAHQAEDRAETILKRIFEGAYPSALSGLSAIAHYEKMMIWRPLLAVKKSELEHFLRQRQWIPFDDTTNRDARFLRARMRLSLFPDLQKNFGKDIVSNLNKLADFFEEYKDYIKIKLKPYLDKRCEGLFGSYLDFSSLVSLEPLEKKSLLKLFLEEEKIALSYQEFTSLYALIFSRAANRRMRNCLYIDRGKVFHIKYPFPTFSGVFPLESQVIEDQQWRWEIELSSCEGACDTAWNDWWKGQAEAFLPLGAYQLSDRTQPGQRTLDKWWTTHKIPAFLRSTAPIVVENNQIAHEFLTGNKINKAIDCKIKIVIKINKN